MDSVQAFARHSNKSPLAMLEVVTHRSLLSKHLSSYFSQTLNKTNMAGIIGIVALAMYGDRSLFYQDPYSYIGGYTKLTPLGEVRYNHGITIILYLSDTRSLTFRLVSTTATWHFPPQPLPQPKLARLHQWH